MRNILKYIVVITLTAVLIAGVNGCTGTGDTPSNGQTSTTTATTGSGELLIIGQRITNMDDLRIAVGGTARNTGNQNISEAEITVKFYNIDGTLIDTGTVSTTDLGPGKSWQFKVPLNSEEAIADFQVIVSKVVY